MTGRLLVLWLALAACSSESADARALREAREQAAGSYRRTAGYAGYLARFPDGAGAAEARRELAKLVDEAVAAALVEARAGGAAPDVIEGVGAVLRAASKSGELALDVAFERTIAAPYEDEYIPAGEATVRGEVFRSLPGGFEAREAKGDGPAIVVAYQLALDPASTFEVEGKPLVGARLDYTASARVPGAPPRRLLAGEIRLPAEMATRTFHRPGEAPVELGQASARNAIRRHLMYELQRALSKGLGRGDRRGGWPGVAGG